MTCWRRSLAGCANQKAKLCWAEGCSDFTQLWRCDSRNSGNGYRLCHIPCRLACHSVSYSVSYSVTIGDGGGRLNSGTLGSYAPPLFPLFERQDDIFFSAFRVLENAMAECVFPGASVAVTDRGRLVARKV